MALFVNHEWTRMHTNFLQSTEYTEETESLADVGPGSEEFVDNMYFFKEESRGPPSARRFVTLRASGNNVMRKLDVLGLLTWRFIMLHMRVRLRRSAHLRIVKINSCLRFAKTVALESDPPKSSAISTA